MNLFHYRIPDVLCLVILTIIIVSTCFLVFPSLPNYQLYGHYTIVISIPYSGCIIRSITYKPFVKMVTGCTCFSCYRHCTVLQADPAVGRTNMWVMRSCRRGYFLKYVSHDIRSLAPVYSLEIRLGLVDYIIPVVFDFSEGIGIYEDSLVGKSRKGIGHFKRAYTSCKTSCGR